MKNLYNKKLSRLILLFLGVLLSFNTLYSKSKESPDISLNLYTSQKLNAGLSFEIETKTSTSNSFYDELDFDSGFTDNDTHFYFNYAFGEKYFRPTKYWAEVSKYAYNASFKYNKIDEERFTRSLEFGLSQYYAIERKLFWGLHFGTKIRAASFRVQYNQANSTADQTDLEMQLDFLDTIYFYFKWL